MDILFVASVALVTTDTTTRDLLRGTMGLALAGQSPGDEYVFTEKLEGCKHFGVWPLAHAARSCFGTPEWPRSRPVPQVGIELEVKDEA